MNFRVLIAQLVLAVLFISPVNAAVLVVGTDGQLLGADDVEVAGEFYDVRFIEGTCADLFSACDENSDFSFGAVGAAVAAQALLDQVALDVSDGNFDSVPSLTNGCASGTICIMLIPYATAASAIEIYLVVNGVLLDVSDSITTATTTATFDTLQNSASTYAVFSKRSISEVPLPAAFPLFLLGLSGIGLARRKRSNSGINAK